MLVGCTVQSDGPTIVPTSQDSELTFRLEGESHITYLTIFFFTFQSLLKPIQSHETSPSRENIIFIWKKHQQKN